MKINFKRILPSLSLVAVAMLVCSCGEKFHIEGNITEAQDSMLYLENMTLNGPEKIDSAKLSSDGQFAFEGAKSETPEFYRLRIAGQIINISIDSTETVKVKASYPTMASDYTVEGSDNCLKIKELAQKQMALQTAAQNIAKAPMLTVKQVADSIQKVMNVYKEDVKKNYIFKEPGKAYAYFALFQYIVVGNQASLIFNPSGNAKDNKVFGAVATQWDNLYPNSLRAENLHNIAIQGIKNQHIIDKQSQGLEIPVDKVSDLGLIEVNLPDSKGNMRRLSSLRGQAVLLDFHIFAAEGSTQRIMMLRELYNKYHAQGLEIYQVSLDQDEHFWKTQTAALPWICVHDPAGLDSQVAQSYNLFAVPTFFLIDRNCTLQLRDAQVEDIEKAIQSIL